MQHLKITKILKSAGEGAWKLQACCCRWIPYAFRTMPLQETSLYNGFW